MLIRNAEILPYGVVSLRSAEGIVQEIGADLAPRDGEEVLDAEGGALFPGLHDHHLHLLALAASLDSVGCGPPQVANADELQAALQSATTQNGVIRGFGYHESVAGELDREKLDRWRNDLPLRIQHRSGTLWILNSKAIDLLQLDRGNDHPGVEHDARGRATGRLFRCDAWLRVQWPPSRERMELRRISEQLASFGITSLTDASASNTAAEWNLFAEAIHNGELLQNVQLLGSFDLPSEKVLASDSDPLRPARCTPPALTRGAVKILLHEAELPTLETLTEQIARAHTQGRGVALHCVTRTELIFAATALAQAGVDAEDRIEHASVAPPDAVALLAELASVESSTKFSVAGEAKSTAPCTSPAPLQIVTQPHFLFERGDQYLVDVEAADRPWLYRGRGFLNAGLRLRAGSDAPYGSADPWFIMRCAVERKTASGITLRSDETLTPEQALALFFPNALTQKSDIVQSVRECIAPGKAADFCLLDRPWQAARCELSRGLVRATFLGGEKIWQRGAETRRK